MYNYYLKKKNFFFLNKLMQWPKSSNQQKFSKFKYHNVKFIHS